MTMFGYIDNDKQKVHRVAKEILSPALGRSADELENLLLFGSTDQCLKKINTPLRIRSKTYSLLASK